MREVYGVYGVDCVRETTLTYDAVVAGYVREVTPTSDDGVDCVRETTQTHDDVVSGYVREVTQIRDDGVGCAREATLTYDNVVRCRLCERDHSNP